MTDDATDGDNPSVDPSAPDSPSGPRPIPELAFEDESLERVPAAVGSVNGHQVAPPAKPLAIPVSDEDRTSYGLLLDRAAERGLLSEDEYQRRLGELAEADDITEMRQIVSELPAFAAVAAIPPKTKRRRHSPSDIVAETVAHDRRGRRRSSPWLLLAIIVIALVVSAVLFTLYAEHLMRAHNSGVITAARSAFSRAAPRL